jgi:hypothetical protein
MDPDSWGPPAWIFLHSVTLTYPLKPTKEEMKNYYNFFMSLQYILPCNKCRYHYKQNLIKYPLSKDILSSKKKVIKWLYDIHNNINRMNSKRNITLDEFYYKYSVTEFFKSNDNSCYNYIIIVIIIIICIVVWLTI